MDSRVKLVTKLQNVALLGTTYIGQATLSIIIFGIMELSITTRRIMEFKTRNKTLHSA